MAWEDLAVKEATLKGIAPRDLYDPSSAAFDFTRLTTEYEDAAREVLRMRILARVPFAQSYAGGVEAFFDDAEAESDLQSILQHALGNAFLMVYYQQERLADDDRFFTDMGIADGRMNEAVDAFARVVDNVMSVAPKTSAVNYIM